MTKEVQGILEQEEAERILKEKQALCQRIINELNGQGTGGPMTAYRAVQIVKKIKENL